MKLSCSFMFAQVEFPEHLAPKQLDQFLDRGWFRMGQTIFTTNFLHFKQQFYSALWLRVDLKSYQEDKVAKKLFRQNKGFRFQFQKASLDIAREELFARYKQGITFEASPSLYQLLYGKSFHNIYNTYEVNVFDGDRLIAAGYFDIGKTSAAGITSFYDPEYKKYSLGKFLIILKMQYCKQEGKEFFYPGYFVPGYSYFNYKLELGRSALSFLDLRSGEWKPIDQFSQSPFDLMLEKLKSLQDLLRTQDIESRIFRYEFFDANLFPELKDAELFDYPLFLNCFSFDENLVNPMVVYDPRDDEFRLIQCRTIWTSNLPIANDEVYSYHLLKIEEELMLSDNAENILMRLLNQVKYKSG